ncbi:exported protein of unknown function [Beijerinckiaceae bacterium RH AL1]|nr:exported protein of unknown function [Beijerinckiaceae bacterium RH CH11]VVB49325.1 exported protein of unknown function [Beijerinckiaceae bacterium RH AL8]VVC56802.1 exported protein of unknown function [Beijerinckiaceae bacterium RH AL1]
MRRLTLGLVLVLTSASAFAEAPPVSTPKQSEARLQQIEAKRLAQQEARRQAAEVARQAARDAQLQAAAAARVAAQQQQAETSGIPPAPGYVAPQAVPPDPAEAAKKNWATQVRSHTAQLLAKVATRRGHITVSFKVSETGDVFNVEVTGEPHDARLAAATLRSAHMPAPPDQRDHTITVGVNVQDGRGPMLGAHVDAAQTPTHESAKDRWLKDMVPAITAATIGDSLPPGIPAETKIEVGFRVNQDGRPSIVVFKGNQALKSFAERTLAKTKFGPLPNGIKSEQGFTWVFVTPGAGKDSQRSPPVAPSTKAKLTEVLDGSPKSGAPMTFTRSTPKATFDGENENQRWMNQVYAMLEAKIAQLPHSTSIPPTGKVAICFHVGTDGRIFSQEFCAKSGRPETDALVMRALHAAAPFPPPPTGINKGLIWVKKFDSTSP